MTAKKEKQLRAARRRAWERYRKACLVCAAKGHVAADRAWTAYINAVARHQNAL